MEPIVYQARRHEFEEGWMAALQAIGAPANSPLRNPEQIPSLEALTPIQNLFGVDDEDTPSMKEMVQEIDSYVESIDLEVTSNFDAALHTTPLPPTDSGAHHAGDTQTLPDSAAQPANDATNQPIMETDPVTQA